VAGVCEERRGEGERVRGNGRQVASERASEEEILQERVNRRLAS